jgi:hypothetical protein
MNFLHDNDIFGKLVIEETYLDFDGPRLFIAVNAVGQRYVVNCLDIDEDREHWVLTPVSDRRLGALRDGEIDLRTAYTNPELDRVYTIVTSPKGDLLKSAITLSLTEDMLPNPGALLPVVSKSASPLVNAPFLARTLNANIVLLRLFPKSTKHEAPAESVGDILAAFAAFLREKLQRSYREAEAMIGQVANAAALAIPEVNVVGAFAGSLGVEFAVRGDEARIMDALRSAVGDLASVSNLEELYGRMNEAGDAEVSSMRKFLSRLSDAKSDLSVEAASISDDVPVRAELTLKKVRRGVRQLRKSDAKAEPVFLTLEVTLVGINLRAKTFEVRRISDDEQFKGTLNAEVFSDVSKAELPSPYRVVLEVGTSMVGRHGPMRMVSATRL